MAELAAGSKIDSISPCYTYNYRISMENYTDFNMMLVEFSMGKSKRKMRIFGALEVIVGILMLFSCFLSKTPVQAFYYILGFSLLPIGVFSMAYHTLIFPKQMKKSIEKTYRESEYLNGTLTLHLFKEKVEDISGHLTGSAKWSEIAQIVESDKNFLILLSGGKGLILPKEVVGDEQEELAEFLKGRCEVNGKQYSIIKYKEKK